MLNVWSIVDKSSMQPIGIQMLFKRDKEQQNTTIEMGIFLSRQAHGKLIPEEAIGSLIQYAFAIRKVKRLIAAFSKKNLATIRFVKKLGFIFDDEPFTNNSNDISCHYNSVNWHNNFPIKLHK